VAWLVCSGIPAPLRLRRLQNALAQPRPRCAGFLASFMKVGKRVNCQCIAPLARQTAHPGLLGNSANNSPCWWRGAYKPPGIRPRLTTTCLFRPQTPPISPLKLPMFTLAMPQSEPLALKGLLPPRKSLVNTRAGDSPWGTRSFHQRHRFFKTLVTPFTPGDGRKVSWRTVSGALASRPKPVARNKTPGEHADSMARSPPFPAPSALVSAGDFAA
jgi:hypothetical protein